LSRAYEEGRKLRHTERKYRGFFTGKLRIKNQKGGNKVAYTPELTESGSATLRRIAWALDKPMSKTLNAIFEKIPSMMDREKVCESCRDPSACSICGFNGNKAA